ncbi:MAG: riboflavin kinase [Minisyncoccia bacterium]
MIFSGIVVGGSRKAAGLGYPTANIPLAGVDVSGVYSSIVELDGVSHRAVSYADTAHSILESHLFDFTGDLYGKPITVTLGKRIREGEVFESDAELARAIATDAATARAHHETT